jgi:hypothetical protein
LPNRGGAYHRPDHEIGERRQDHGQPVDVAQQFDSSPTSPRFIRTVPRGTLPVEERDPIRTRALLAVGGGSPRRDAEEDARDGPIQEVVRAWERESVGGLADIAAAAQRLGEIGPNVDVRQLAFELYAFIELANFHFVLFRDPEALERGRRAVAGMFRRANEPR